MARRLAPSIVVTFSAALGLACTRSTPDPIKPDPNNGVVANPPVPTTTEPSAVATTEPTAAPPEPPTRKRKRTAPRKPTKYTSHPTVWSDFVRQNPTDADGRTIFVAHDDRCFYEVQGPPPTAPLPTGARNMRAVFVDCPPELDDPAWDHCLSSILSANVKTGECQCMPLEGNPPPPPAEVSCPAKKKTAP